MASSRAISPPTRRKRRASSPRESHNNNAYQPSKRQLTSDNETYNNNTNTNNRNILRIFAWNVNSISPLVQQRITSFFPVSSKASSSSSSSKHEPPPSNTSQPQSKPSAAPTGLRSFLRRQSWPQVVCLQEVKISPTDTATQRAVQQAITPRNTEDTGPSYTAHFDLPTDNQNCRGFGQKMYGVAVLLRDDFASKYVQRVRGVDWDHEGRVLVVECMFPCHPSSSLPTQSQSPSPSSFTSSTISKFAILSIYAPNGTTNPYRDPVTGSVTGTRHDRKLAFHTLLLRECQMLESQDFKLVLAGDFNVARDQRDGYPNLRTRPEQHVLNRRDFIVKFLADGGGGGVAGASAKTLEDIDKVAPNKTQPRLHAIDTFRHLHPNTRKYTYYPRNKPWGTSCDRVDMVLVSRGLESRLVAADMLDSPGDRASSDHVPIYVELVLS
ncbi:DNase I-like protein [Xylona heveae TC161]|uniref:DNase I-like protein n=1 Tax=Xylona heveae (strain CBS 132557 / TC161) TaxID=1328760 RepID=A0A165HVC2_XYLHT|nr:DNase I-like protein [Xylona heveae TC161]KZF23972.1 DNase I-like protein [Xylona heveae TC161]